MSQLKIFISSTHLDLKYLRYSLKEFISELGHFPILFEYGDIPYLPGELDESCYEEVKKSDIFILIIGKRYGLPSNDQKLINPSFHDKYDSITKKEYETALNKKAIIYVLIESDTFADYNTFKLNGQNNKIIYANTESINTFFLIDAIISRNHPFLRFNNIVTIKEWMLRQLSGLFQEMIMILQAKSLKRINKFFDIDHEKIHSELFKDLDTSSKEKLNMTIEFYHNALRESIEAMMKKSQVEFAAQKSIFLIDGLRKLHEQLAMQDSRFFDEFDKKYRQAQELKNKTVKKMALKKLENSAELFFLLQEQLVKSYSELIKKYQ